jgi:hypothetical protein
LNGVPVFTSYYPETMVGISSPAWNFSSWIPDLVAIFLGINDQNSGANQTTFITAYHSFITTILGHYPNATILCIADPGSEQTAIQQVVAAETTSLGHKKVYYLTNSSIAGGGCDWHPNAAEQRTMANNVIAKVKTIMGWDTTSTAIGITPIRRDIRPAVSLQITKTGDGCMVFHSPVSNVRNIEILDIAGHQRTRGLLSRSGSYRWNTAEVSSGMYLIGNDHIGWIKTAIGR